VSYCGASIGFPLGSSVTGTRLATEGTGVECREPDRPMLTIRDAQLDAFEQAARTAFENEMVAHSLAFTPRLCEVLGEAQLRVALRQAIRDAEEYGFTYRGPIRLFIELTFLLGSDFPTDPQYPAFGEILRASDSQIQRAEAIHDAFQQYHDRVSGPAAQNVHKALNDLLVLARTPLTFTNGLVDVLLREMTRIFPQKAAYVGEDALRAIIEQALVQAAEYRFETERQQGLLAVLKFGFGHGCTDDPLYPWISRTLKDPRIVGPAARAARLEKKAIVWLEHVVARNTERAPR
jgi:hypothetical protein